MELWLEIPEGSQGTGGAFCVSSFCALWATGKVCGGLLMAVSHWGLQQAAAP